MPHLRLTAFALVSLLYLLAGCGADSATTTAADRADAIGTGGTIRLLVQPTGTQSFPPYVIQKRGLDEKYGFDLEIKESTDPTTAFRADDADAMVTTWNQIATLKLAGTPVVGVTPFLGWVNTVVTRSDSGIDDLGDLAGKRIGIFSKTNVDWFMLDAVAEQDYGVDLESEATLHEAQAPTLLRGLLEQGELDATQMYNDLTPSMVAGGNYKVITTNQQLADSLGLPADAPYLMYAFNTDFTEEHPDDVRAFVKAYQEAIDILMEEDEPWVEQAANIGMTDSGEIESLIELTRPALMRTFAEDTEQQLQRMSEVLLPLVGAENLGFDELPRDLVTDEFLN